MLAADSRTIRVDVARDEPDPVQVLEQISPPPELPRVWPAQLDREQLDEVFDLALVPPGDREALAEVAYCESRWSPAAKNPSGALGLLQLMPLWFGNAGEDLDAWADPVVNVRAALGVLAYDRAHGYDDWAQWSCKPWTSYRPAGSKSPTSHRTISATPTPSV